MVLEKLYFLKKCIVESKRIWLIISEEKTRYEGDPKSKVS